MIGLDPKKGREQKGVRPCLVVSTDALNRSRFGTVVVCPVMPDDLAQSMEKVARRRHLTVPELLRDLLAQEATPGPKDLGSASKSLADEAFIGIWKDRADLADSTAWVRSLRSLQESTRFFSRMGHGQNLPT